MKAGDHKGRPYYRQRDTEGNTDTYIYSEGGYWLVSDTLGESAGFLLNHKSSPLPPTDGWEFWDPSKKARYDDGDISLTLEFTALSPSCQVVQVT